MPSTPRQGARAITEDLMARLKRHYIKPSSGLVGGVFLPEVGWNGGPHSTRCDAIYAGFTSTSGRLLVGHEVKATRSDWLRELDRPGKADPWADECHEWWLVAPPCVVTAEELPDGWGLMLPGTSRTRMKVAVRARRFPDRTPSWDATRSLLARMDTLRSDAIKESRTAARAELDAEYDERVQRAVHRDRFTRGDDTAIRDELERIHTALGVRMVLPASPGSRSYGDRISETTLASLAELLRVHRTVQEATGALLDGWRWGVLDDISRAIDTLKAARANASSRDMAEV